MRNADHTRINERYVLNIALRSVTKTVYPIKASISSVQRSYRISNVIDNGHNFYKILFSIDKEK